MNLVNTVIDLILIAATAIVLLLLNHYLLNRYHRNISKSANKKYWKLFLISAIRSPSKFLIITIALVLAGEITLAYYSPTSILLNWFTTIKILVSILTFTWAALSFIKQLEKHFLKTNSYSTHEHKEAKQSTIILSMKLCFTGVATIGVISTLQALGVSMQAIITFVSLGGVTVGFAARDLVGSLFGTMLLYISRPFTIGDKIKINTFEGYVENITWLTTHLRSDLKRLIMVPNLQFLVGAVENISQITAKKLTISLDLFHSDINLLNISVAKVNDLLKEIKSQQGEYGVELSNSMSIIKDSGLFVQFYLYFDQDITLEEILIKRQEITNILSKAMSKYNMRFSAKIEE